jgi:hypothetical protein
MAERSKALVSGTCYIILVLTGVSSNLTLITFFLQFSMLLFGSKPVFEGVGLMIRRSGVLGLFHLDACFVTDGRKPDGGCRRKSRPYRLLGNVDG